MSSEPMPEGNTDRPVDTLGPSRVVLTDSQQELIAAERRAIHEGLVCEGRTKLETLAGQLLQTNAGLPLAKLTFNPEEAQKHGYRWIGVPELVSAVSEKKGNLIESLSLWRLSRFNWAMENGFLYPISYDDPRFGAEVLKWSVRQTDVRDPSDAGWSKAEYELAHQKLEKEFKESVMGLKGVYTNTDTEQGQSNSGLSDVDIDNLKLTGEELPPDSPLGLDFPSHREKKRVEFAAENEYYSADSRSGSEEEESSETDP